MTIAFQLAIYALIVTSSILLISVPIVFASTNRQEKPFYSSHRGNNELIIRDR